MTAHDSTASTNYGQAPASGQEGRVNENEPSWYELDWTWDEAAREPREWMK